MDSLQGIIANNKDPERYRKSKAKVMLQNEIYNTESRLKILKAQQAEENAKQAEEDMAATGMKPSQ